MLRLRFQQEVDSRIVFSQFFGEVTAQLFCTINVIEFKDGFLESRICDCEF